MEGSLREFDVLFDAFTTRYSSKLAPISRMVLTLFPLVLLLVFVMKIADHFALMG